MKNRPNKSTRLAALPTFISTQFYAYPAHAAPLSHEARGGIAGMLKQISVAAVCLLLSAGTLLAQPTISSVYPPALKQRAGEHLAFNVTASGSGTLTYQWYFQPSGQPSSLLSGQTNQTLIVTNIQTANSGQYWVAVGDNSGLTASNFSTLTVSASYLPLAATNLIVARVGDGVQALSQAKGNTLYFDQYTTGGAYVSTVMVPDKPFTGGPSPGPSVLVAGAGNDALFEGLMVTSSSNQFLTFAGYNEVYPFSGSDVTLSSAHIRALASLNAYGYYSLVYTNPGLYSGGAHFIRGCASSDLTNFWITGAAGAGGIKFANTTVASYATGNGLPTLTSSGPNPKVAQYIGGNLYFSDQNGANIGLFASIPAAMPAPSGTGAASIFLNQGTGGRPNDFAFSPDLQTVYIADDRVFTGTNAVAGGIERWDNVGGTWTFAYTLATGAGATNGALGLNGDFSANGTWGQGVFGAILYATTTPAVTNRLIAIQDNGPASPATVLVKAGLNESLHGVRFGPSASVPVSIVKQPQNQLVPAGSNAIFSVTPLDATGPFTYQWYKGANALVNGPTGTGSAIAGATASSLTISNISASDCVTNYSVAVFNPATSINSSPAGLDEAIIITTQPVDAGVATGATATFTVAATGNGTLHYQWQKNGIPLADGGNILGSATPTLSVQNAQVSDIAGYSVVINDDIVATNTSRTAYLELATLGAGTGLLGQYWSNQTETAGAPAVFNGAPALTRIDPTINFPQLTAAWPGPTISQTLFAVIWSGKVQPLYSDTYTFYATTDDGVRVFVDGQLLIDAWVNRGPTESSGSIDLVAGQKYDIVMQYYQGTGGAAAELSWSSVNFEPKRIVPQAQLFAAAPPNFVVEPVGSTNLNEGDTLFLNGGSVSGTPPFSYQWYTNSVPVPGQTNTTLTLANVPAGLDGAILTMVASNSFGAATNTGTSLAVSTGAPSVTSDIPFSSLAALVGEPITFPVQVSGTLPVYQWTFNGTNLTDNGRIVGSHSNVLTIVQALQSDTGTYQLLMTNGLGINQSSPAAIGITRVALNDGGGWDAQGVNVQPAISGNGLGLTDGGFNEAASSFITYPLYIGAFRASFTYQDVTSAGADGTCFVMQNAAAGPSALGGNGASLGFTGITPSAALEFNLNPGSRGGVGIAFGTNGLTGANSGGGGAVGDAYSSTAPVNIASGDPINVTLQYLGGILSLSLTDPTANTSFSTSLQVNLPAIVRGNTAYVGFTGATSATASQQTITNFFFSSLPTVSVITNGANTVRVAWPSQSAAGFVLQQDSSLGTTNWVNTTNLVTLTNGQYQVIVSPSASSQFYRLTLP